MAEFPAVCTPPWMQLSVVCTIALPLKSTDLPAFELTCSTQLGAVIEIAPLPLT